jgi:endoglucanase
MKQYLILGALAPWCLCSCDSDSTSHRGAPGDGGIESGAGGSAASSGGAQNGGAQNGGGGKASGGSAAGGRNNRAGSSNAGGSMNAGGSTSTGGSAGGAGGAQGTGGKQNLGGMGMTMTYPALPYRGISMAGAEFGASYGGLFNGTTLGTMPGSYYYPTSDLAKGGPNWPHAANGTAIETDLMMPYFRDKGMNTVRLPLRWERLQRSISATSGGVMKAADVVATFDKNELAALQNSVDTLTNAGFTVLIDIHNYAAYTLPSSVASSMGGTALGQPMAPNVAFENLWIGLGSLFMDNAKVVFDIMNEPNTPPDPAGKPAGYEWYLAAQAAVDGIRSIGATNMIFICGNAFAGPVEFMPGHWSEPLKDIKDPMNNFAFEVHDYPDDAYGTSNNCTTQSTQKVVDDLQAFVDFAHKYNAKGFLGEFSAGIDVHAVAQCNTAIGAMLKFLTDNSDVFIGWVYWAAGAGFGQDEPMNYPFFNNMKDSPQLTAMAPFLK